MTEDKIKEMLKDIVNNGAEYEYRNTFCNIGCTLLKITKDLCNKCKMCPGEKSLWKPYKLGDEIKQNFTYRKVEKWYVVKVDGNKSMTIDEEIFNHHYLKNAALFCSNSKEDCVKWIEENTKKT